MSPRGQYGLPAESDFGFGFPRCPHPSPIADSTAFRVKKRDFQYGTCKYVNGIGFPIKTKKAISDHCTSSRSSSRSRSANKRKHSNDSRTRRPLAPLDDNERTRAAPCDDEPRKESRAETAVKLSLQIVDTANLSVCSDMVATITHASNSRKKAITDDSAYMTTVIPAAASDIRIQLHQGSEKALEFGYDFETYLSTKDIIQREGVKEIWLNVCPPPVMVCGAGMTSSHCLAEHGVEQPRIKLRCETQVQRDGMNVADEGEEAPDAKLTLKEEQEVISVFLCGNFGE